MPQALKTPPLSTSSARENPLAGGVRRDKAGQLPTRITARLIGSVFNATGAAALTAAILLVGASRSLAADPAPPPDAPVASKTWPPTVQMLSPSAPLNRKSQISVGLVRQWRERNIKPTMGARGEVRFIYGATEDTVVCAPLRLCDIALQPGEIVQNINLGDPVLWSCPPAISGSGLAEVTHLMCKPSDAGLETSLAIQTSRRSYSINLVSTRKNYMPMVSWSYPEDQATAWAAYQTRGGGTHQQIPAEGYIHYQLSGDSPTWKPVVAYSDGKSTYINFPPSMAYGKAPVLERVP
jgi:type IV secretion system protein VirB9